MFKQRLISGIVIVIIMVATLYMGGNITLGVIGVVSLIGVFELQRIFKIQKAGLGIAGYIVTILYYMILLIGRYDFIVPLLILFLMLLMSVYVFSFPKFRSTQVMAVFFGFVYVSMMLSYVFRIRILPNGGILVVLIFLSAWGNDTLAYCTGMLFGKHKMSPKLSPKKSIEGAVGGVVGAAVLGVIFGSIVAPMAEFSYNPVVLYPIVCGLSAVISIVGDLAASAIKRNHDIKDYGNLIPGHGGILDRFDSIIFTAPIVYYLMMLMTGGVF